MQVCIAGWYLEKFDDFYQVMHRVNKKHPVKVVSNRKSDYLKTLDIPWTYRGNTGLEWGAYNNFLFDGWDCKSDVLFCHDDIIFYPYVVNGEIKPPELMFDKIAEMGVDQCYIFSSRTEDVENHSQHGRMVFMSGKFLAKAKESGGFFFDSKNCGYTEGSHQDVKEGMGCLGYNAGIISFHAQAQCIGGNVHRRAYIPAFGLAVRGNVQPEKVRYGKWLAKSGEFAENAKRRLHLGCGTNVLKGYTNVDLFEPNADVNADVRALPFADNSFDWIEAHHLIEHLPIGETVDALREWKRVVEPGGHVFLSCPDLIACMSALVDSENTEIWSGFIRAIYGQDDPGMPHRNGFCIASLSDALNKAGFVDVEVKSVIGYRPTPSLLAIAKKE